MILLIENKKKLNRTSIVFVVPFMVLFLPFENSSSKCPKIKKNLVELEIFLPDRILKGFFG